MHFYFINNYINILNYEQPISPFLYRIESPFSKEQYTVNDINISPALVKTHNGLIFDNINEEISYIFDRNDVYIENNDRKMLYMVYCFFLKNIQEYYERIYKRIQDVISSIGGIYQAITIIGLCINNLYNNYIVLSDTEILLHSSIHYEKQISKNKASKYKNLNNKFKDSKRKDKLNDIGKSSETRIESEHIHNKRNKTDKDISINNMSKSNNIFTTNIKDDGVDKSNINNLDNTNINNKEKEKEKEKKREKNEKEKTFCNYFIYKITCGKKRDFFDMYQKFRVKIISEEHLIRNHLNIYNLMKVTERKRHTRRNSYQLKDLINLV